MLIDRVTFMVASAMVGVPPVWPGHFVRLT